MTENKPLGLTSPSFNQLIDTVELALVYMLGDEMLDKRPTISFPQIVGYFFKPETRNKLGDEVSKQINSRKRFNLAQLRE